MWRSIPTVTKTHMYFAGLLLLCRIKENLEKKPSEPVTFTVTAPGVAQIVLASGLYQRSIETKSFPEACSYTQGPNLRRLNCHPTAAFQHLLR
uniref:Uncharacterized protein n=1 Tax=Physcomitrium patens TaxID=3218 RepID=A0A2K1IRE5_PHYPA|nr:hypothetical protein PHYPA_025968 [Physcomitrium patens]